MVFLLNSSVMSLQMRTTIRVGEDGSISTLTANYGFLLFVEDHSDGGFLQAR
jgi:hypothetical protein